MTLLLAGVALMALSGLAALALSRAPAAASRAGAFGAAAGCALGVVPAIRAIAGGTVAPVRLPWPVPSGSFSVGLDPLSGFFLLPTLLIGGLAALYGVEYLRPCEGRKAVGASWLFYDLLLASMALVLVARNAVLFLVAWETMALSSFFLVAFEHEREEVREAGWTYLVATHLGTAFLIAFFLLLGRGAGGLDLDRLPAGAPAAADLLFVLAVIGFGTKAGFLPMHVWLPEAHPAAPSHVSAVMSGVMIKTGIYGLVRALILLGPPPAWRGWLLVAIGLTSGVIGVLFALAQHDLKRLLAYHSVENIGIIALGLGVGLLGLSSGAPVVAVLGFAGGLLHVWNHALFKGLLFLGAGSVLRGAGTGEIDLLGGLLKRMPWTGATFLAGAYAIAGLPPMNGFVSEFAIFLAALLGAASLPAPAAAPLALAIAGLALIGGLAAACFAKAFGVAFLGEPRGEGAAAAREAGAAMRWPMAALAAACALAGLLAPLLVRALGPVLAEVAGIGAPGIEGPIGRLAGALGGVLAASGLLAALAAGLALARRRLLAGRPVERGPTWGCGYARPTVRMQYTASSFAEPLTALFAPVLRTRRREGAPAGPFPARASFSTETPDACRERIFHPAFAGIGSALRRLHWIQHGRIHLYVLALALTLAALLVWKLGLP